MQEATPSRPFITRESIVWSAITALLLLSSYSLYRVHEAVLNSYAVWWVADMVVEHLKANDGQWPADWDDLRKDYRTCVAQSGQPWTFDQLSERVVVDWDVRPDKLLAMSQGENSASFKVITLSDGTSSHWETREPNQIILDYLRSTTGPSRASSASEQPSANCY